MTGIKMLLCHLGSFSMVNGKLVKVGKLGQEKHSIDSEIISLMTVTSFNKESRLLRFPFS